MGMLVTSTGTQVPVPLNDKEEELQLRETLQRSTVKRRVPPSPSPPPPVHYLENGDPLGLEL